MVPLSLFRCGLLTYYIPFPLSLIHAQQPILQAALLSTYFDNPCGDSCDRSDGKTNVISATSSFSAIADTTVTPRPLNFNVTGLNLTFDKPLSQDINDINDTNDNQTIDINPVFRDENLLEYSTDSTILMDECSGSGSGDDSGDNFSEVNVAVTDPNSEQTNVTNFKDEDEWKALEIFKSNDNRTDKDVFEEIYNKTLSEVEVLSNKTETVAIPETSATDQTLSASNESRTTSGSPQLSIAIPKRNRISWFHSNTKCDIFNSSMCTEWSTDRLLRVRLCCLSEMLADDDSGFGCGHFERGKCNRMLPLIKCCLKDFSQLLDNYYQSVKASPRPSRQRFRDQLFPRD